MRAAEHMRQVLNATGIYRLTGGALIDQELKAYGAGFALLEDAFQELYEELFVKTAPEERLKIWERLFRPQTSQGEAEKRRDMVLARLSVRPEQYRPQDFSAMLRGACVHGTVRETPEKLKVVLGGILGISEEEARRELDRLLPAHLPWEWEKTVSWLTAEARGRTFGEWDGRGLTWAQLEALDWDGLWA